MPKHEAEQFTLNLDDGAISFDEYQRQTFDLALPQCRNLTYMCVGLGNESGELLGKLKKSLRGDPASEDFRQAVLAELGDVLWYVAGVASVLGADLASVAQSNIDKLLSRRERGSLQGNGDSR